MTQKYQLSSISWKGKWTLCECLARGTSTCLIVFFALTQSKSKWFGARNDICAWIYKIKSKTPIDTLALTGKTTASKEHYKIVKPILKVHLGFNTVDFVMLCYQELPYNAYFL